jgi:hypothetical protein
MYDSERQLQDRPLFPGGVVVAAKDLAYEAGARAFHTLRRQLDGAATGVVSGLTVTVDTANSSRIAVSSGAGYAPNGAYANLALPQTNVALADPSAKNYVYVFYTETQDQPRGHEADGTSPNTRAVASARVRVYTKAQFDALPASSDDLSVDARDRGLLAAVVTGAGLNVALTASSIESPKSLRTPVVTINQPVVLTGVDIVGISQATSLGQATLDFKVSTKALRYIAPGETTYGDYVDVSSSGDFTIASNLGVTLKVAVQAPSLPATDMTLTLTVSDLYGQSVPAYSGVDHLLRSKLGSGLPTATNPLGLSVDDLSGSEITKVQIHQDLQHSNGLWRGSDPNLLKVTAVTAGAPDHLSVQTFAAGGDDRAFIQGYDVQQIVGPTTVLLNDAGVESTQYVFDVYLHRDGALVRHKRAELKQPLTSLFTTNLQVVDVSVNTIGSATPATDAPNGQGTISLSANDLAYTAPGGAIGASKLWTSIVANTPFKLYSGDGVSYVTINSLATSPTPPGGNESHILYIYTRLDQEPHLLLGTSYCKGPGVSAVAGWGASNTVDDKRLFGQVAAGDLRDDLRSSDLMSEAVVGLTANLQQRTLTLGTIHNQLRQIVSIFDAYEDPDAPTKGAQVIYNAQVSVGGNTLAAGTVYAQLLDILTKASVGAFEFGGATKILGASFTPTTVGDLTRRGAFNAISAIWHPTGASFNVRTTTTYNRMDLYASGFTGQIIDAGGGNWKFDTGVALTLHPDGFGGYDDTIYVENAANIGNMGTFAITPDAGTVYNIISTPKPVAAATGLPWEHRGIGNGMRRVHLLVNPGLVGVAIPFRTFASETASPLTTFPSCWMRLDQPGGAVVDVIGATATDIGIIVIGVTI